MRKERKESLLCVFPPVPRELMEKMQKKGSNNYAVFLTRGRELFVRCFHHYSRGGKDALAERQRYVFAKDGYVRYGSDDGIKWAIRTKFTEPRFAKTSYGYSFDNSYSVLGYDAIKNSDMRYSQADRYHGDLLMSYLALYIRHPNVEYLMKQGYSGLISSEYYGYWGTQERLTVDRNINWKTNDMLKMLGLNRAEFKALKGREELYLSFIHWRTAYPDLKTQELMMFTQIVGCCCETLDNVFKVTGRDPVKLVRWLYRQNCEDINDYKDYLDQCRRLKYDMSDRTVLFPRDLGAKHEELTLIEEAIENERKEKENAELTKIMMKFYGEREKLSFAYDGLIIRQPESVQEIVSEGARLGHCVAGYAERHAKGVLHIMFLRRADRSDEPYYTVEVSKELDIVQCRGYKNNVESRGGKPKPEKIRIFEKAYQEYLDRLKTQKARKTA